jgi:hypothetical protein
LPKKHRSSRPTDGSADSESKFNPANFAGLNFFCHRRYLPHTKNIQEGCFIVQEDTMQQSNMSGLTALAALRNLRHSTGNRPADKKSAPAQQKLPDHYIVIKSEKEASESR